MDFPSGPWTGFYNYGRSTRKHRMDLVMTFADHRVSGDGSDDIGRFVINGRFDETSGECYWTKAYIVGHDVYYRGFREGKGIWGLWELPNESGGFHIWPLGQGEGEQDYESAEEPAPVEAVAVETLPGSSAFAESTADKPTPVTPALRPRSIKTRLISSHLHQRRSPRKICLRRRASGTNPS
jgi:hypothetical protein